MIVIRTTMKNEIGTPRTQLTCFHIRWASSPSTFFLFSQLNAILAIVRNGWSFCPAHFCLFTIICPSIPPNKGVPSIQMVILPPEPLSRFRNFESEIVPAIAIMTEGRGRKVGAKMFVRGHDGEDLTPIRPSDWCFRYKLNTHQVYTCIL